jgi:hypothetical protein
MLPQSENFIEKPLTEDRELFSIIVNSILTGRRIGNYEVIEEVGSGGMGAVYRAFRADHKYYNEVAIKLVWPGLTRMRCFAPSGRSGRFRPVSTIHTLRGCSTVERRRMGGHIS